MISIEVKTKDASAAFEALKHLAQSRPVVVPCEANQDVTRLGFNDAYSEEALITSAKRLSGFLAFERL